jgi:hypothetical protein
MLARGISVRTSQFAENDGGQDSDSARDKEPSVDAVNPALCFGCSYVVLNSHRPHTAHFTRWSIFFGAT